LERPKSYEEWERAVPAEIRRDAVWQIEAYRLGLFAADLAWHDAERLLSERRARSLADQLVRAAGSVSANVEEGFSRRTGKERAQFYGYALGSAREARGWYYKGRHVLGAAVTAHRLDLLTQLVRLLLTMSADQRRTNVVLEEAPSYRSSESVPY
jgi:four helix bundle protein